MTLGLGSIINHQGLLQNIFVMPNAQNASLVIVLLIAISIIMYRGV